ncbi:hypothetical protein VIBNISOn1_p0161 [Vibrio nigripulchritudo SOn1]|uniref:Transposase n=1 Tax=Vibrio nigripulchritudo SOn1 TaxID=1238450 RepID=A0AAV2VZY0_9VIBR|nr:hypothetical protein VIBNISOn1_p0161 [Vibrio nigripulchritudo SOn1]
MWWSVRKILQTSRTLGWRLIDDIAYGALGDNIDRLTVRRNAPFCVKKRYFHVTFRAFGAFLVLTKFYR